MAAMALPLHPPFKPMLAKLARTIPDGDGWLFEPKWDGFRCVVFRDGDDIELASRNERPFTRYFPELLEPLRAALPDRCVVDGEIVVADGDGNGLDFDALLQRIHPAESRVRRLAAETPASFVAFDLLALDDESLLDDAARRAPRAAARRRCTRRRPCTSRRRAPTAPTAEEWFGRFEGAGLDGVVAKRLDDPYQPDKRALVKVKHERTADCAVAGYRIHKDGNGVGSLLLGLYDDDGRAAARRRGGVVHRQAFRAELLAELEPLTHDASATTRGATGPSGSTPTRRRKPGATSRWNAGKDLSWVPIRLERVAEVTFGQLEKRRFRHGVSFVRWRPDRTPESCRYDQLDVAEPVAFAELVAADLTARSLEGSLGSHGLNRSHAEDSLGSPAIRSAGLARSAVSGRRRDDRRRRRRRDGRAGRRRRDLRRDLLAVGGARRGTSASTSSCPVAVVPSTCIVHSPATSSGRSPGSEMRRRRRR